MGGFLRDKDSMHSCWVVKGILDNLGMDIWHDSAMDWAIVLLSQAKDLVPRLVKISSCFKEIVSGCQVRFKRFQTDYDHADEVTKRTLWTQKEQELCKKIENGFQRECILRHAIMSVSSSQMIISELKNHFT